MSELDEIGRDTIFELDRLRLAELRDALAMMLQYAHAQDFQEREARFQASREALTALARSIVQAPTRLSFERVRPLCQKLDESLKRDFVNVEQQATPILMVRDVLESDHYSVDPAGQIRIRLELSVPRGCSPIDAIVIDVERGNDVGSAEPALSPHVLRGGESRVVELVIAPSAEQLTDKAFTLGLEANYSYRGGEKGFRHVLVPIRLNPETEFREISNPYHSYSGGTVVADDAMFFGRANLVDRIVGVVSSGPGQCFVLYGQKRSGKSSVLHHVKKGLGLPNLAVKITLGTLDVTGGRGEVSFMRDLLEALVDTLDVEHGICVLQDWPRDEDVESSPLVAFKRGVRCARARWAERYNSQLQLVLLIDEFTYLYEYLKEGLVAPTFMRQWKAMLETGLFSAVVVGQDSMPRFKQDYANEFGVTHDERISYLSAEAAKELAERPVLLDGRSRFRGNALERLLSLTACSPFFTQIFCDFLVRHMNRMRAHFVTEADIEMVERVLVQGNERLPEERFDPLITAAGESVALARRSDYKTVLASIAMRSRGNYGAQRREIDAVPATDLLLSDMVERDVLQRDSSDRYAIRVGIFASWLRENWSAT
jgi:hypothetical protein